MAASAPVVERTAGPSPRPGMSRGAVTKILHPSNSAGSIVPSAAGCLELARLHLRGSGVPVVKAVPTPTPSRSFLRKLYPSQFRTLPPPPQAKGAKIDRLEAARWFIIGMELEMQERHLNYERTHALVMGLTDAYRHGALRPSLDASDPESLWETGAVVARKALLHPSILLDLYSPLAPNCASINVHLLYVLALHSWSTDQAEASRCWTRIVEISVFLSGVGSLEGDEIVKGAVRRLEMLSTTHVPDWKAAKRQQSSPALRTTRSTPSSSSSENEKDFFTFKQDLRATTDIEFPADESEAKGQQASSAYPSPPATPVLGSVESLPPRRTLRKSVSTAAFRPELIKRVRSSSSLSTEFILSSPGGAVEDPAHPSSSASHSRRQASVVEVPPALPRSWSSTLRHHLSLESLTSVEAVLKTPAIPETAVATLQSILLRSTWTREDEDAMEDLDDTAVLLPGLGMLGLRVSTPPPCAPMLRKQRSFIDPTSHPIKPSLSFTPATPVKSGHYASLYSPPTTADGSISAFSPPSTFAQTIFDPVFQALEAGSLLGGTTTCASCGITDYNFPACPKCAKTFCSRGCRVGRLNGGGDSIRHVCDADKVVKRKKSRRGSRVGL